MRLLLDQNLSIQVAAILRSHGFDVVHTGEVGLARAADDEILDWSRAEQRVVVTRDTDFHALLAISGATKPSVIRIRIEPLRDEELTRILESLVIEKSEELTRGVVLTVKQTSIRVRALPLISPGGEGDV